MHGILSFSKIGLRKSIDKKDKKSVRYFDAINVCGKRLLILLDDLLDLSKLDQDKMQLNKQYGDLLLLLNQCIEGKMEKIKALNLQLVLDLSNHKLMGCFDHRRIKQVINNLLSNAIKFTPENKTIHIYSHFISENKSLLEKHSISFIIDDEGAGIPIDELQSVFESFSQSSRTNTGAGGTGLGLAISKQIIEKHTGHIWAEELLAGGTRIQFIIPV
jgi:signal transduction histidine kinase